MFTVCSEFKSPESWDSELSQDGQVIIQDAGDAVRKNYSCILLMLDILSYIFVQIVTKES